MKKRGFTLVELLSVIVILAVILVIAVPNIVSVIEDSKKGTLESTVKMIASSAEKKNIENVIMGVTDEITCESLVKLNSDDYEKCLVVFDGNIAKVNIKGKGRFSNMNICNGNKNSADVTNEVCNFSSGELASNLIGSLCVNDEICSLNQLMRDSDGNVRYYGSNPNNYISFNDEVWRIIGIFNVASTIDGDTEERIKIVRNERLSGSRAFDSKGSQIWQGSSLETYLNGDYYDSLASDSKKHVKQAVWNTGALVYGYDWEDDSTATTSEQAYLQEIQDKTESKIGLLSVSDYGYAGACVSVEFNSCGANNWLKPSTGYYFTMIPFEDDERSVCHIDSRGFAGDANSSVNANAILPVIYLDADTKIAGTGENTEEGIYRIM